MNEFRDIFAVGIATGKYSPLELQTFERKVFYETRTEETLEPVQGNTFTPCGTGTRGRFGVPSPRYGDEAGRFEPYCTP